MMLQQQYQMIVVVVVAVVVDDWIVEMMIDQTLYQLILVTLHEVVQDLDAKNKFMYKEKKKERNKEKKNKTKELR